MAKSVKELKVKVKINVPTAKELEKYLSELLALNGYEGEEFTDNSIVEIHELLIDYVMDNFSVEAI